MICKARGREGLGVTSAHKVWLEEWVRRVRSTEDAWGESSLVVRCSLARAPGVGHK